jgi:RNA polymerase sigma-70 factor (ECF subfamily)
MTRRTNVKDGRDQVIEALIEKHGAAMLAYATRLTRDPQRAEDAVQEALVRAWRNPHVLTNGKGSVRGWLLTVIRNIVIDHARGQAARPVEVADTALNFDVATPDHAGAHADRMEVMQLLDHLTPKHRDVLIHLYYNNLTAAETAAVLGIPLGTVKSRAFNALRQLRTEIVSAGLDVGPDAICHRTSTG